MTVTIVFAMDLFDAKPVALSHAGRPLLGARLRPHAGRCFGSDAATAGNELFDPDSKAQQIEFKG